MRLFVGGIPYSTTEEELKTVFGAQGTVASVDLVKDRDTNQPRGFGFIDMPNDDEAKKAITALNGQPLGGRPMTVNEAKARQSGGGGGDKRFSGSFGESRRY